jgi:hypothetical protein
MDKKQNILDFVNFFYYICIMAKLNFTKEDLEKRYRERLDILLDDCDWITHVTGEMVCSLVVNSLKDFGISVDYDILFKFYHDNVKSLNLTDEEWRENYGIPEIISMIYEIVEKNF